MLGWATESLLWETCGLSASSITHKDSCKVALGTDNLLDHQVFPGPLMQPIPGDRALDKPGNPPSDSRHQNWFSIWICRCTCSLYVRLAGGGGGQRGPAGAEGEGINHQIPGLLTQAPRGEGSSCFAQLSAAVSSYMDTDIARHARAHTQSYRSPQQPTKTCPENRFL